MIGHYAAPLGLSFLDPDDDEKLLINTPQWEQVWTTWANLVEEGILPLEREEDYYGDLFIQGKAAMSILQFGEMPRLVAASQGEFKEETASFTWDIVTPPVHPVVRDRTSAFFMGTYMGISARSENINQAWDFISFINGDQFAKIEAKASQWEMMSRTAYIEPPNGHNVNMEAFYKLKPVSIDVGIMELFDKLNEELAVEIIMIGLKEFESVLMDGKEVKQALTDFQEQGQEAMARWSLQLDD